MKATIYYIELDETERRILNATGWGSEIGQAYLKAREDGKIDESNVHLFRKAATGDFKDAEDVWFQLQNVETPWTEKRNVTCHTDFPRSMDVGDVIDWHQVEGGVSCMVRCASVGFVEVPPAERALLCAKIVAPVD